MRRLAVRVRPRVLFRFCASKSDEVKLDKQSNRPHVRKYDVFSLRLYHHNCLPYLFACWILCDQPFSTCRLDRLSQQWMVVVPNLVHCSNRGTGFFKRFRLAWMPTNLIHVASSRSDFIGHVVHQLWGICAVLIWWPASAPDLWNRIYWIRLCYGFWSFFALATTIAVTIWDSSIFKNSKR